MQNNNNKEIKKEDKISKIIVGASSITCFGCICFGQGIVGFCILAVGLISNTIYKVIKSKKGGNKE